MSSEQQAGQAEQQLKETTSLETQTTKILQLESELQCAKEFMTAKKVMKVYRKFSEKRKPEQRQGNQQTQPERCSTTHGSSRGHFLNMPLIQYPQASPPKCTSGTKNTTKKFIISSH